MMLLGFSMVLKTRMPTAVGDTSLDIAVTRTDADEGGSQQAKGAGAASGGRWTGMGLEGGRRRCYRRGNINQDHG